MKHLSTLASFLVLFSCAPVAAQQWCTPGAQWHYSTNTMDGAASGYTQLDLVGDTIVNGMSCSHIAVVQHLWTTMGQQYFTQNRDDIFTFAVDGVVRIYMAEANTFDTLFNFNALPGATWRVAQPPDFGSMCAIRSYMEVTDNEQTIIDGLPLQRLDVDLVFLFDDPVDESTDTTRIAETILERIGPVHGFMLPRDYCNGWNGQEVGGAFRCYSDNDINFQSAWVTNCVITTGVDQHIPLTSVFLAPNPGADHITLSAPPAFDARRIQFFDGSGRMLLEQDLSNGSHMINVSSLEPGIYIHRVLGGEQQVLATGAWIKAE